ncbi:MAG: NAD-dependent epimerase/dehydratase family protein [Desulfobacterales bacterium]|nr:NAD-dependent epimerase/dehydratase family protein [Desulfobacterales bacterium]
MDSNYKLPELNGQKILITGGLGFIGSNLAHKCLELGAEVTIFDCLDPRSGGKLYNIHEIKDSVELCCHDILNFDRVSEHIVNKDIIFNCAASTSHPFSMREPWIDLDVNSRGVINLLEAVRRFNKDAKFVHLGTSTQLGKLQYQPADEKHPEFPTDIYSANKSVSEKYVLIYSNAYQMRASVIRLPNVFGPRSAISSPEFTFNNFFIGLALQGKDITVFGDGKQKRNVIYVEDAVSAVILASMSEKTNKETFFAVGDHHYSVAHIAEATVKYIGSGKVRYVDWPKERKAIEVGDAILSNQKIKSVLDWKPLYDLENGLIRTRKYYDNCDLEKCFFR